MGLLQKDQLNTPAPKEDSGTYIPMTALLESQIDFRQISSPHHFQSLSLNILYSGYNVTHPGLRCMTLVHFI